MAALANTVLDALLVALRVDHTDLGGTYDLTTTNGTPRVIVSDTGDEPIRVPMVALSGASLASDYEANLTEHGNLWEILWVAWVAADAETPEARVRAGQEIAADVVQSIQRAHRSADVLRSLTTLIVSHDSPSGGGQNTSPRFAGVSGTIRYRVTSEDGG